MKKILYVDDEELNLNLFRLNFMSKYEVNICQSAEEALDLLDHEQIDVVITDYKMPKVNGIELIEKIKRNRPSTVCMILSGYIQDQVLYDKQNIFKYILKPYDRQELSELIEEAFRRIS